MKTKENGENIYKMMNELQKYPYLYEKGDKGYKEKDWEKNAQSTVEQFLIVPL